MRRPAGGKLDRLRLAVQDFVQAAGEQPSPQQHLLLKGADRPSRKSRRDARKEKRRLKRSRRRLLRRGETGDGFAAVSRPAPAARPAAPASPAAAAAAAKKQPEPPRQPKKPPPKEPRPPLAAPRASAAASSRKRGLLEANEEEDREIRRLERQLGFGKRRRKKGKAASRELPQSFLRDGLGYVLGALGTGAGLAGLCQSSDEEEGPEPGGRGEDAEKARERPEELGEVSDSYEESDGDGQWDGESSSAEDSEVPEGSEAPEEEEQEDHDQSAAKYIPPQVRKAQEVLDDKKKEELGRLKKIVNGLINRLSEPNLSSISGQLEELYMANSRKDMNETLTNILMNACVTAVAMPARLVMEHVLLVSVLHHTVGTEVGAHFLEAVVKKFDELSRSDAEGKECENLLALIAHLYNFHVVHCLLIFDILKKLVSSFTEKDIELILFLLKNVGFSLRKDDALALKDLISEAQSKANTAEKELKDQTRIRFMLETMLALRNNDMRKIPGYDPEPVEKLRKLQRTLVHSSSCGKETQLRVSLESLLNADRVGRWWIVGSSWSGAPMISNTDSKTQQKLHIGKVSSKIMELARKQRMNTDIRRSIFCVLMTSEDFMDAFEKLLKLGLKDQQEREIVHVILYCCLQEKTYNPFYAFLASKMCGYERRFRVIEFGDLDKPKVRFLRQVLSMLLVKTDEDDINDIFGRISDNPKLGILREGLKLFLTHFLLKNAQVQNSAEEASVLKERAELASRALQAKESKFKL
ncbi:hypothetical protein ASZ78_002887 [Callipepla squamata]|uniref:Nucleolar MIF4G domain-containing protein 1 n=1 Tax=Callipepla squamata TaxID=9009 RepID=A0A226N8R6_CALSU|nr:hypothetical protein ASZ78_002887 [Callipepla squamata]